MEHETMSMLTLQRLFSLFNNEMTRLVDPKLQVDLQGIEASTDVLLDLLRDAEPLQMTTEPVLIWLLKLEDVAYQAEAALDDLRYQILHRKVHNTPLRRISFLSNAVFNSDLVHTVKTVNRALRTIYDDGKQNLKLARISSGGTLLFRPWLRFCLTFRLNFGVHKEELIQLWLAAGLLPSYDEAARLFEITFPISNNDLKEMEKDEDGNIIYKVQKLLRSSSREYGRRSCDRYLHATTSMEVLKYRPNRLRSLILDGIPFQNSWQLERLVILVFLDNLDMKMLPSSIERLRHLRYLDISNTSIKVLPKFVTKLYNLQTLRFLNCKQLYKLPRQFSNLINMKNIAFSFEHQMLFGVGHLTCLETLSFFVLGSDWGGSIEQLRFLNKLRGNLNISRLEAVKDIKEAERANLGQKENLDGLSFQWSYGAYGRSSSDKELLEALRPNPHIQKLKIKYYMGGKWPSWMLTRNERNGEFTIINNLVSLTLERCWTCVQLPCLGDLPLLEFLTLKHMDRVKCIYNDSYKQIDNEDTSTECLFPALKSLSLSWMQNLTEWSSVRWSLNKKVVMFPRLETLIIQSCAKLTSFPVKDLSALVKIEIKDCEELRFSFHEQQSFPTLTNLSIEGCPKLTYLRNWFISNQRFNNFKVRRCEWLKFIPDDLQLQSSLVSLEINCCKGLSFFPEAILCKLTQLRTLSIGAFSEKMDDFRYLDKIQDLPHLRGLEIWGSDFVGRKMSYLPEQLQHLTGLKSLKIVGFTTMVALPEWLSNLPSLWNLSLNYCWHLEYQSTAAIIGRLPNFNELYTYGCQTLEQHKFQWNEFSRTTKIRIHFPSYKCDTFTSLFICIYTLSTFALL